MTPSEPSTWSDERIDGIIGRLLQTGVLLATLIVFIGGVGYLIGHGGEVEHYRKFHREAEYSSLSAIFEGLTLLHWPTIIQVGILVLVATPVARVIFSVFAFGVQRDWLYVTVTLMVLAVLLYSLFVSAG